MARAGQRRQLRKRCPTVSTVGGLCRRRRSQPQKVARKKLLAPKNRVSFDLAFGRRRPAARVQAQRQAITPRIPLESHTSAASKAARPPHSWTSPKDPSQPGWRIARAFLSSPCNPAHRFLARFPALPPVKLSYRPTPSPNRKPEQRAGGGQRHTRRFRRGRKACAIENRLDRRAQREPRTKVPAGRAQSPTGIPNQRGHRKTQI